MPRKTAAEVLWDLEDSRNWSDGPTADNAGERIIEELRAAGYVIVAQQEGEWQPMETAPKDRRIWVWGKGHGLGGGFTWQGVSCWDDVFPQTHDASWGYLPAGVVPEYWREVPAPPKS